MVRQASHIALLCFGLLAVACGPTDDDASDGSAADVAAQDGGSDACHSRQIRSDGRCCPTGQFYDFAADQCHTAGPPECAAVAFGAPETCVPRWCWDLRTDDDKPCGADDGECRVRGRSCTAAELSAGAGCAAGMWPDLATGACRVGGALGAKISESDAPLPVLPWVASPEGVPPMGKLPDLLATQFCQDKGGKTRICNEGEQGCGAGKMPDPEAPGSCMPVGVHWLCPPGFVPSPHAATATDDLRPCLPDPSDCGDDPFGGVQEAPGVTFVHAGATKDGDGSRATPYQTLAKAVTETAAGGTIAVAAGTYQGGILIDRSLKLLGRCAAKVHVTLPGTTSTGFKLWPGDGGEIDVLLEGMTIGAKGLGVVAFGGVHLVMRRTLVDGAHGFGVGAMAGEAHIEDSVIRNCVPKPKGWRGEGVAAAWGGRLNLLRVRLSRNQMAGMYAQREDSELQAERVLVDGTRPTNGPYFAHGLAAKAGKFKLRSVRLSGNHAFGIRLDGDKSSLQATGLLVDRTGQGNGNGLRGEGVYLQNTQATLAGVRLHQNRIVGLLAAVSPTKVACDGLIVDGTREPATVTIDNLGGAGISVADGAHVTIRSVRLTDNRHAGVGVTAPGSKLVAERLLVDGTRAMPSTGQGGPGVVIRKGGLVVMKYARLYDNRLSAIAVEGKSAVAASRIELTHGVIDQTRGSPIFPNVGSGASIENGAHASLTDVRVSRSLMVGVQVIKSSSRLVARRLLVDETQPTLAGQGGHGLTVDTGASATVVDARFSANHQACVAVMRPGSKLDALGLHVDGTKLGPKANGIALGVLWGATATVQGSRFVGNIGAGIYSHGVDGTVLRLRGSRVENTLPGTGGGAAGGGGTLESAEGNGLTAWRPAQTVEVSSCLFRGNHGVSVYLDEASGSVKGCAIVDTKPSTFLNSGADARGRRGEGPEIKLADGILARNVGDVHISHTLVVDQLRAGILLVEKGKVAVTNSMAARGQFGLVMQSGVKTTLERNVFFENSSNIDGSGALFVPPPPTLPVM